MKKALEHARGRAADNLTHARSSVPGMTREQMAEQFGQ
jgi:hypothetical protein